MKKYSIFFRVLGLSLFVIVMMCAEVTFATPWLTDPIPSVTYSGSSVTVRKELSGFPNYGVVDQKSDVLYTGDYGSWTFDFAALGINVNDYFAGTVIASLVLDDHYNVPTDRYALDITLPQGTVFSGATDLLGLVHGTPYGSTFTNWTSASFDSSILVDPFVISMSNISSGISSGDWIAIDSIEITLSAIPEPGTVFLLGISLLGLLGLRRKVKK